MAKVPENLGFVNDVPVFINGSPAVVLPVGFDFGRERHDIAEVLNNASKQEEAEYTPEGSPMLSLNIEPTEVTVYSSSNAINLILYHEVFAAMAHNGWEFNKIKFCLGEEQYTDLKTIINEMGISKYMEGLSSISGLYYAGAEIIVSEDITAEEIDELVVVLKSNLKYCVSFTKGGDIIKTEKAEERK